MRRILATLLFPTLVAAVVAAAPVPTHLLKDPMVYYPTIVGAKWVYDYSGKEETRVVTAVEDTPGAKVVTVETEEGGKLLPFTRMTVSASGLTRVEYYGVKPDPPQLLLRLPFAKGDKWESKINSDRETKTVSGREKVKVPAGTFETVRVDTDFYVNETKYSISTWFAPGIGPVQWVFNETGYVLKSFTPGTGKRP